MVNKILKYKYVLGEFVGLWVQRNFRGVAAAAVLPLALALAGCYMPVVDNKDVERARQSQPIPYKQLTTKNALPIIFQSPEYLEAISSYPTTRDCLTESENLSDSPDLRLIDWTRIRQRTELDVCLWYIFSSFGDFQAIIEWMNFHKLKYSGQKDLSVIKSLDDLLKIKDDDKFYGAFYWYKALPFRDENPVPRYALGEFEINIVIHSNGKVISVHSQWQTTM